jgi:Tetratricopeptide repeat
MCFEMTERPTINAASLTVWIPLLILIGAAQSCAPHPVYRAPTPPASRAPVPVPVQQPAPVPAPVQEPTRKPLPQEPNIKEQNLPSTGSSSARVFKEPVTPWPGPSAQPELPTPLPDDSSLLAKITASTQPQRAASLRLTDEGRKLVDGGAPGKGLPRLEQSIAIDSTNPYGYFYLAKAHHKLGRYKESLSFLDVAESRLTGEPYWLAEVYALRGENYRALGMAERADASYIKALSINPGNRTAVEATSGLHSNPAAAPR